MTAGELRQWMVGIPTDEEVKLLVNYKAGRPPVEMDLCARSYLEGKTPILLFETLSTEVTEQDAKHVDNINYVLRETQRIDALNSIAPWFVLGWCLALIGWGIVLGRWIV